MTFKKYLRRRAGKLSGTLELPKREEAAGDAGAEKENRAALTQDMLPYASILEAAKARQGKSSSHLLLWAVAAAFFSLFAWAALAKIDESITAAGQVIPSQGVQHIQNLEGGILEELLVREGQEVEAGDLLLRIFNEQAGSIYRDAVARQDELGILVIRLRAELSGEEPKYPDKIMQNAPEAVQRHNSLLAARRQKNATEISSLQAQLERSQLEEQEMLTKQKNMQESLNLAIRQRDLARKLFKSRSYSEMDLLNHEQQVQSIQAELDGLKSSIPKTRAAIRLAEERLSLHRAENETRIREELNQASSELASVREIAISGADRVTRTEVRSPVKGLVNNIIITTKGGVIMPGQTIMQVVPIEDSLIIEAKVRPQDIGFIYVGQKAKIRLSAYDFAVYGSMEAVLEHISADTTEGRMGEFYYTVRLRTTTQLMDKGQPLQIMPGMLATADIITGRKTVLSYIARPLLRARQSAAQGQ